MPIVLLLCLASIVCAIAYALTDAGAGLVLLGAVLLGIAVLITHHIYRD